MSLLSRLERRLNAQMNLEPPSDKPNTATLRQMTRLSFFRKA